MTIPQQVLEKMWANDHFSQWLDLKIDAITEGVCRLHFIVRKEMLNGHQTVHGGILFSAADSAFAFACNSHGRLAVGLEVSISYTKSAQQGEILTVEAQEVYLGNKTSVYDVKIRNEQAEVVAVFKGTAYRTSKNVLG
ncbi:MAG: hydroxyphenylacetyl-CoA thioesterase PaaI [Saprospiraceae bacterium]|nr:hydroxyphenylacetyl-CoA thioesterase PaaI [Saprospiraceae bacterium]